MDIFDLFKKNASKLDEPPPEQTWAKLEQRLLQRKRPRRKGIQFLQLGAVVLIVLVLIVAILMVMYYKK